MTVQDRILFEDNHLIVINKLSGEIVQGDASGDMPLVEEVKHYLKEKYNKPGNVYVAVVHRIDRPVAGVVMFAKTGKAAARMSNLIANNRLQRKYLAITCNKPEPQSGILKQHIFRNEQQNKSYVVDDDQYAVFKNKKLLKKAELNYRLLSSGDRYHLVEVELVTGRHHQIRAQLASIGCVIKGDLKYGAPRSNTDGSISLLAYEISFMHPVKNQEMTIRATIPDDNLWNTLIRNIAK